MLQSGFWAPATYDYGSTGTRPPQDLRLPGQLTLQRQQFDNESSLLGQRQGFEGQQNALQRAMTEAMQGRQLGFQGEQAAADRGFQGGQSALDRALRERMQSSQFGFQGEQAALDRTQAERLQNAALSNQLTIAGMPIEFARERFNQIFPMVQGAVAGAGTGGGAAMGSPGGIERAPGTVYTPGQIDQNVNAMRAGNSQAAATQQRQNAAANAAGGFGSNSPLLAALNNQAALGALAANTGGERDIRLGAASANAKQGLGAASANNQARAAFEANAIDAQRNQLQSRSSLIAALAGML